MDAAWISGRVHLPPFPNDDGQLTAVCFANTNTENSCYSFYAKVDEYRLCLHKEGCSSCADLGTEWENGLCHATGKEERASIKEKNTHRPLHSM